MLMFIEWKVELALRHNFKFHTDVESGSSTFMEVIRLPDDSCWNLKSFVQQDNSFPR